MQTAAAKRALEAARVEAGCIGKPVSIAIVDAACVLVLFERMDGVNTFTAVVAEGKACASAFTGRASGALAEWSTTFPSLTTGLSARLAGRFMAVQGAVPIRVGDELVGAIGVSGAAADEDERIAQAGAATFAG